MLAAWGTAYLQGAVSLDEAIEHLIADGSAVVLGPAHEAPHHRAAPDFLANTPLTHERQMGLHQLPPLVPPEESSRQLSWVLTDLSKYGITRIEAAFPAPGDLAGLPSGLVAANALAVGEAVIIRDAGLILIPTVDDPHDAEWAQFAAAAREIYISPAEAQQELTEKLTRATDVLIALDVPSWDPAYGRISTEALHSAESDRLPSYFPRRATVLLHRAAQLDAILSVAAKDSTGGAVNSHEARARAAALAPLGRAVRRALAAAYNSAPYKS